LGSEYVAAIVIEPIQGEGGFIVPAEGFLPTLVDYAREKGIVFVADEVQAGFARTGKMFASEWEGIVPDLVSTAKGIAGGLRSEERRVGKECRSGGVPEPRERKS